MKKQNVKSLPLYPEGRRCTCPTTRQVIDTFAPIARHWIEHSGDFEIFYTELAPIHKQILKLLKISVNDFQR